MFRDPACSTFQKILLASVFGIGACLIPSGVQSAISTFPPSIATPAPGTILTSSTVTFTGTHTSQDYQHWVYVGSTPTNKDYYAGAPDRDHQFTVSGLPSSGTIYVRYYTRTCGTCDWEPQTHSYQMNSGASSSNSAVLQWAANQESDLAGYRVYHGTTSGNYGSSKDVGKQTAYQYTNLASNTTHYFSVTAYDLSGNESSPTPEVFKKLPGPDSVLSISISGQGMVTSNPTGISCTSGTCSGTFPQGTSVTLTATPNTGNTFSGWSGACSGTSSCGVALSTTSASVSAAFATSPPLTGTLNVTLAGTGSGTVTSNPTGISCTNGTCSGTFPQGTSVTLTATPNTGNTFSGWSGACSGTSSCGVALSTTSASVSAAFATSQTVSHSLSLSLTGDGKGSVTSSPSGLTCSGGTCTASFPQGTTVTLTPVLQAGNVFQGWNGACGGTSSCVVTLNSTQAVGAVFTVETSNPPPMPALPFLVNFQPQPSQVPTNFKKDDGSVFDSARGYGWNTLLNGTEQNSSADQTLDTFVSTANLNPATWNFPIPNGTYYVTMVLGDPKNAQGPHWVETEGLQLTKQVKTSKGEYLTILDYPVEVKDLNLSIKLGSSGQGQTVLNYLIINSDPNLPITSQVLEQSFGTPLVASVTTSGGVTKVSPTMLTKENNGKKPQEKLTATQIQESEPVVLTETETKKQKEQEDAAMAKVKLKKQKEQEVAALAEAKIKKQKEHEVRILNEIKEKIISKRNSGDTVSLRSLFGK